MDTITTAAPRSKQFEGGGDTGLVDLPEGALADGVLLTIHRLSQGGADRVTMLLANGFAAAGIPTGICVFRDGGEGERALLDMLDDRVLIGHAGRPMGSRHLELVRGFRYVQRQIARTRPGVVLASSSNMGLVTGLCARRLGPERPPFIMKLTNPVLRPRDRGMVRELYRRILYRFIFGSYDRVLILSDEERRGLIHLFPEHRERFETVANPYVAPRMLSASQHQHRLASGGAHILSLARMMPQKRLDRLLDAFARVSNPQARLTILGDGPERPRLERQARALGIAERVSMPGFVDDVLPWLFKADLFALSSDYEGLPAVVLEALACNVPVVTTDCFDAAGSLLAGAPRCATVPRDDVDALARAIETSLSTPGVPAGLDAIARPYSFDAAIAAHVREVREMLARC